MEETTPVELRDCSTHVERCYERHGRNEIKDKLPNHIDGFERVVCRALWAMAPKGGSLTTTKVKGLQLISDTVVYHPHGDGSIYGTLIRLAQPFKTNPPLVYSFKSSVGGYYGTKYPAPRYVNLGISEFAIDVFYRNVHKDSRHMTMAETGKLLEPVCFVGRIPTALLYGSTGIAVGFSSSTYPMFLGDVCAATRIFIEEYEKNPETFKKAFLDRAAHLLLPNPPTAHYLHNKKQLISEYKQGNFAARMHFEGEMALESPDVVVIRTMVPKNVGYENAIFKLKAIADSNKGWMVPYVSYTKNERVDKMKGRFRFHLKRGANAFEFMEKLRELSPVKKSDTPVNNYVSAQGFCISRDPVQLLTEWYRARKYAVAVGIKNVQQRILADIRHQDALKKIAPDADRCFKLIRSSSDRDAVIQKLVKRYKLTPLQASHVCNMRVAEFSIDGIKQIDIRIAELKERFKQVNAEVVKIPDLIKDEQDEIARKYSADNPGGRFDDNWQGFVRVPDKGIVQWLTLGEMLELYRMFGGNVEIVQHASTRHGRTLVRFDNTIESDAEVGHSKYVHAKDIVSFAANMHTIRIHKGKIVRFASPVVFPGEDSVFYVGSEFIGLDKNGNMTLTQTSSIPVRRSQDATGVLTKFRHIARADDDMFILHMNPVEANIVRVDRVQVRNGKLTGKTHFIKDGKSKIIGVLPRRKFNQPVVMTLPANCLNRTAVRHLVVQNLDAIADVGKQISIQVNTAKVQKFGNTVLRVKSFRRTPSIAHIQPSKK